MEQIVESVQRTPQEKRHCDHEQRRQSQSGQAMVPEIQAYDGHYAILTTISNRNAIRLPWTGFLDALTLYNARPDKGYSLTDCISMQTMRREGIIEG
jgi:hypothetical protein